MNRKAPWDSALGKLTPTSPSMMTMGSALFLGFVTLRETETFPGFPVATTSSDTRSIAACGSSMKCPPPSRLTISSPSIPFPPQRCFNLRPIGWAPEPDQHVGAAASQQAEEKHLRLARLRPSPLELGEQHDGRPDHDEIGQAGRIGVPDQEAPALLIDNLTPAVMDMAHLPAVQPD